MTYRVLQHDYSNTGGHCMVSSFQLFNEDTKQTVFMLLNEDSASIASADYVMQPIDYDDVLIYETVIFDQLDPSHENFELYRDCLIEFIKVDCKYNKTTTTLRYALLNDELRSGLCVDYINWHEAELGDRYETDGERIICAEDYAKLHLPKTEETAVKEQLSPADREFLQELLGDILDECQGGEKFNRIVELMTRI